MHLDARVRLYGRHSTIALSQVAPSHAPFSKRQACPFRDTSHACVAAELQRRTAAALWRRS